VLGIVLQGGLIGRLAKRFGDSNLVQAGLAISVLGFTALAWAFGIKNLLLVAGVLACSTGVVRPAITSLITQATSRGEQGSVLGLTQSLQSVAQILAPFLAGLLIQHGQLHLWALAAALCAAIGYLLRRHPETA
jgi:MFS family permease